MFIDQQTLLVMVLDIPLDALMLMMTLRILRVRIRPVRVCFAAVFGAVAAGTVKHIRSMYGFRTWMLMPLALGMLRISAGKARSIRHAIHRIGVLFACAGFLGGTMLALCGALGSYAAAYVLSCVCSAAIFVSCLRTARTADAVRYIQVECRMNQKTVSFEAILDSGNSLRDYLTHRPVIVAGTDLEEQICRGKLRQRLIFADTAGGRQMMRLVIPEKTVLFADGERVDVQAALAFSPGLRSGAAALVPSVLLGEKSLD